VSVSSLLPNPHLPLSAVVLFQWERPPIWPEYTFPECELMKSLIDLYFGNVNCFLPILHRPIFESKIRQEFHLGNQQFGSTVLLVCALGSRFSDDPRVFSDPGQSLSSGWKWYEQVQTFRRSSFEPSSLYELQYHCVRVSALRSISISQMICPASDALRSWCFQYHSSMVVRRIR